MTRSILLVGATLALLVIWLAAPAAAAEGGAPPALLFDTASWALIAGVLTPPLTSIVIQPSWSARRRTVIGVTISVVVAVVTLLGNGAFVEGPQTVLSIIALVVVTSAASYRTLWRPAGVAPRLEQITSPRSSEPEV